MARQHPTDIEGAALTWCLDLDWGGRTYRLSTQPVDLTTPSGAVVAYQDGLSEPSVVDAVSRQGVQESDTVPLAVLLDGVDVAQQIARGYRLEQARGHLFAVFTDVQTGASRQDYDRRFRYLTGRLSQPVYADPSRPVGFLSFTLDASASDDNAYVLDESASINPITHPNAPSASTGKVYPTVIGTPGVFRKSDGTLGGTSGSPAYVVLDSGSNDWLLIAGHGVQAVTVTVYDADRLSDVFTVEQAVDGLGRLYSYVNIHSGSIDKASAEYWVSWTNGGGITSPFSGGTLEGLGSVCAWALLRSSLVVDVDRWLIEAATLDRVKVATYLNTPTLTPMSLVTRLLEPVQTEVRTGPDGLYPQPRLLNTADAEGLQLIVEGPDMEPSGPMITRTKLADVINRSSIRFAPRAATGDFKRTVTVQADPDPADPEAFPDEYAEISVNRWTTSTAAEVVQSEVLELDWIYDDSSAALIARERVQVFGFGYAERDYTAHRSYGWLHPGVQVRWESATLHRTYLATVLERSWNGISWDLVIAFDDDPIRGSSTKIPGV